jgi:acetyl-CoA C-acetyltransferase
MARPRLDDCPAQTAVLQAMRAAAPDAPELLELYTCFPVVPKMARRVLGLPGAAAISVTGGLTFHGAPFNSFMAHAAAMMVRRLREGGSGLLYGQGGHLTAHHALLLGRDAAAADAMLRPSDVNPAPSPAPSIVTDALGPACLESVTIPFNPDGTPARGTAVLRLPDGARTLASVAADDSATLALLMAPDRSAVGHEGRLVPGADGLGRWVA